MTNIRSVIERRMQEREGVLAKLAEAEKERDAARAEAERLRALVERICEETGYQSRSRSMNLNEYQDRAGETVRSQTN